MLKLLTIKQGSESYRLSTSRLSGAIDITVLHQGASYHTKVSAEDANHWAEKLGLNGAEYLESLYLVLTKEHADYVFDLSNGEFNIYKDDKQDKYFSAAATEMDYKATVNELIVEMLGRCKDLRTECEGLQTKKMNSRNAAVESKKMLFDYVGQIREYKDRMYATFGKVLNAKKRRIQFLMDIVEGDDIEIKTKRAKMLRARAEACEVVLDHTEDNNDGPLQEIEVTQGDDFSLLDEDEELKVPLLPARTANGIDVQQESVPSRNRGSAELPGPSTSGVNGNDASSNRESQNLSCSTQDLMWRIM